MFANVATNTRHVEDYIPVVGEQSIEQLHALARPLQGLRTLHLSSPGASPAVRTLLKCGVPLMGGLGLNAVWQQVRVPAEYLEMDHQMRRGLSGYPVEWTEQMERDWWEFNLANAQVFDETFDVVIVHHTASVGLRSAYTAVHGVEPSGTWVWALHRDYRAAQPEIWKVIREHAAGYDASVYSYRDFIRTDAPVARKYVISPGLDPLGPSSMPVSDEVQETILTERGIDVDRPVLGQVIMSLRREDHAATILETFRRVKQQRPDVQLVVVNLQPETHLSAEQFDELRRQGEEIGGVLVLTEMDRVGNVELSALRQEATVLIHQGFPRGISMELLEEMWQARPIVSSRSSAGVILLQDGETGLMADTPEEQAAAILRLLDNPEEAERLGKAAHQYVAQHHLVTHFLEGYLQLLNDLTSSENRHHVNSQGSV